jgi:hypothetical protein
VQVNYFRFWATAGIEDGDNQLRMQLEAGF